MNLQPEVFAEIASARDDRRGFEMEALAVLDRELGFDVAWFMWETGPSPVAPGFDPGVRARCRTDWPMFGREIEPVVNAARDGGGVAVDRDVLGWTRLWALRVYEQVIRPHGGTSTAIARLHHRDEELSRLILGRTGRCRFSSRELDKLRCCVPVLALATAAYKLAAAPDRTSRALRLLADARLTPREAKILEYLPLGYTNGQIALAIGSSPRTVRNQLSRLYEKLGVATRAEAAAVATQREHIGLPQ